ncbi:MAG: T9SS type A sorting domain-containing protein [Bacteroidota bacterium]
MKRLVPILLVLLLCTVAYYYWQTELLKDKQQTEQQKEGDDKMAPYEYFEMARNYPEFTMDIHAFNKAIDECRMGMHKHAKTNPFSGTWVQEGPTNIGGRIVCLAVHPTNSNIIFAGSVYGGIYKSTDGGNNWRPVFDSTAYLSIGCITIDKSNPNIMYAGTGDPSTAFTAFTGNGIYKSTNGGENWSYLGLSKTGVVAKIAIDPSNSQIVFAATMGFLMRRDNHKGVYKSTDGGVTWSSVLYVDNETGAMDVVIHPGNSQVMYATTMRRIRTNKESIVYGNTTGLYKSVDGGNTWGELTTGLPPKPWCKVNVELHPTQPNTLFASVVNQQLQLQGIYRSTTSGTSWQALNTSDIDSTALGGFGWYFGEVRVNPYNVNHILLQGVDLWESKDGGSNWDYGAPEWYQYIVHADKHDLHFLSASSYLLATDGGVYKTTDGGVNWNKLSNFPITQFYHVSVNPWEPGVYYGGAQDQGTSRGNATMLNDWGRVLGGDGFRTEFSNTDEDIIWASTQNGRIYYSLQKGINFTSATDGVGETDRKNWDSPYLLSKHNRSAFLGTQYVYKADDYGFPFFQKISPDLTDGNIFGASFHTISALKQHEVTSKHVYAGTSDGNVWRSTNEGDTWQNITTTLPDRYVTNFATSFLDSNLIYVTHSGYRSDDTIPHIHRSTDNGTTWENISGNLPTFAINDVLSFDKNDSILAVATDGGVYITIDSGATWNRMGNNMPVFPVFDLDYDSVNYKIIAGTFARSAMSYDVKSLFKKNPDPIGLFERNSSMPAQVKVYPVPLTESVNIELPGQYKYERLSVVNTSGQRMYATHEVNEKLQIQTADWGKGVYFVLVYVEGIKAPLVKKILK